MSEAPTTTTDGTVRSTTEDSVRSTTEDSAYRQTVHVNLSVRDAASALDFYARAFGAVTESRVLMGTTVVHSEVRFGNSLLTVAEQWPQFGGVAPTPDGPTHASVTLDVPDVDAAFTRALAAGATVVSEPADQFHGDRTASLRCPFGHRWFLSQHLEDLTEAEMQRRTDEWMAAQATS